MCLVRDYKIYLSGTTANNCLITANPLSPLSILSPLSPPPLPGPKLSGDRPLYIHVVGARGLPQVTRLEKQDPFATIEILGQDVRGEFKWFKWFKWFQKEGPFKLGVHKHSYSHT